MRYPLADYQPAPLFKTYQEVNKVLGVVLHSMEGGWDAARRRLMDNNQPVSWQFSVLKDGTVIESYPVESSCWHGGNKKVNTSLVGIEHEGVAGEPLTGPQEAASVALVGWLAQECHFALKRPPEPSCGLWEHQEVVEWIVPNAGPTACPSGRIPWEKYLEEPMVELDPVVNLEEILLLKELVSKMTVGGAVTVNKVRGSNPTEYRLVVH